MTRVIRFLPLFAAFVWPAASLSVAASPDPSDPAAVVPAVVVLPALTGYRVAAENALASWAEVHREVQGSSTDGGHAGHGAARPMPDQSGPSIAPETPNKDPHAGHRMERP
ncbi:MAG: hypothetical protein KIT73_04925 [Burkholderiales bacterium]|nr:hypothetical protein [Burkholderiales bacterium]